MDYLEPTVLHRREKLFLNLLVNAAHSIKEKVKDGEQGTITICTRLGGQCAEIAITDTGTGIPEEIQTWERHRTGTGAGP